MTKKKTQVSHLIIKREECEDKHILEKMLYSTKNASNNKSKITKHKTVKTWIDISPRFALFKSDNEHVDEPTSSSSIPPLRRRSTITTKQIMSLIDYIVNGRMSIKASSRKAGMSEQTGHRYYREYRDDPERKIPLPRSHFNSLQTKLTQKQIEDAINYIVRDKMSISQAAIKANVARMTVDKYYAKYLKDPEHKIPAVFNFSDRIPKTYTQEQINRLIGYLANDKMSMVTASRKVNVDPRSARRYYLKYLQDPNHEIPTPGRNITRSSKICTSDQIKSLIGYITNDRMSLLEASVKANIGQHSAIKYYTEYLKDPNHKIPTPETKSSSYCTKPPTDDQLKKFFSYIIIDELTVSQAAYNANISDVAAYSYYNRHLKNPAQKIEIIDYSYSVEKMKKMVKYIQKDKMSLKSAANKAELSHITAIKYYRKYVKNPQLGIPIMKMKQYTQNEMHKLIELIEHDKMNVSAAARALDMGSSTACKYYRAYKADPEHKIPILYSGMQISKQKRFDRYSQIVADIYKNNPSIKPIHESHYSGPELPNINI